MALFRRKPASSMPDWAVSVWSPTEYDTFLAIVSLDLGRRGRQFELRPESGTVVFPPDTAEESLTAVGRACAAAPSESWPDLIEAHFTDVLGPGRRLDAMDYDEVESLLRVRVVAAADFNSEPGEIVTQPLAAGLLLAPVIDFPMTMAFVREPKPSAWGRTAEELIATGLENLSAAHETLEIDEFMTADDVPVVAIMGESHYTATSVLALDSLLAPLPDDGLIVAVPHRHVVLAHRIQDARAVAAVAAMGPMARNMYDEGPGSISPHLYWLRNDGTLVALPMEQTGDGVSFSPPPEFLALLERLSARGE